MKNLSMVLRWVPFFDIAKFALFLVWGRMGVGDLERVWRNSMCFYWI